VHLAPDVVGVPCGRLVTRLWLPARLPPISAVRGPGTHPGTQGTAPGVNTTIRKNEVRISPNFFAQFRNLAAWPEAAPALGLRSVGRKNRPIFRNDFRAIKPNFSAQCGYPPHRFGSLAGCSTGSRLKPQKKHGNCPMLRLRGCPWFLKIATLGERRGRKDGFDQVS